MKLCLIIIVLFVLITGLPICTLFLDLNSSNYKETNNSSTGFGIKHVGVSSNKFGINSGSKTKYKYHEKIQIKPDCKRPS